MKKCLRLTKNFEFINVYKAGRRSSGPLFTMYIKKNKPDCTRLGVSISKKVGKSVVRNRIKRRIKEAFRTNLKYIKKGYDVVISVKPEAVAADYGEIEREIRNLLKRGNLWDDRRGGNSSDKTL
ncbi:ribonuclease P protein component [Thermoanaerobacterium sp. DL9XJH110]|uniref:ribonuclease P protein component n=1 Tax=Thermoanaerobacterium sp. DL9XJH110 TaxID=3386643 RepID=UPI003BB4BF5A